MSISSLSGPRSQIASTHSWTFSKKHLNILVDVTVFLGFLALVFSGLLMTLVLPRGNAGGAGGALNLWGLNRHQWGDLHLWVAIGFMGIVAVHLVLHRTWIWGAVTGGARASKSRRVAGIIILGIGLALAVGAAGTPFLLEAQTRGNASSGEDLRGQHHRWGQYRREALE